MVPVNQSLLQYGTYAECRLHNICTRAQLGLHTTHYTLTDVVVVEGGVELGVGAEDGVPVVGVQVEVGGGGRGAQGVAVLAPVAAVHAWSTHYKICGMIYLWMESEPPIRHGHQLICLMKVD